MILTECIKKIVCVVALFASTQQAFGQITEGKIVFERRTNLKKKFGSDDRMGRFVTDENKIKTEKFELLFTDSNSVYQYVPEDVAEEGFLKYMTTKNTVYQNLSSMEKTIIMDLWGTPTYLQDSMENRQWKVTESTRNIAGHECRKAIWEKNDSTRIYAWFTVDIVASVGPESFFGLPGAILGLATEDGGIIYFAKEVVAMKVKEEDLIPNLKGNDVYNKEQLKAILAEKMGKWLKPGDLDEMFSWL